MKWFVLLIFQTIASMTIIYYTQGYYIFNIWYSSKVVKNAKFVALTSITHDTYERTKLITYIIKNEEE